MVKEALVEILRAAVAMGCIIFACYWLLAL